MKRKPGKHPKLFKTVGDCVREGRYIQTVHVQLREIQRNIVLPDILNVLETGRHEKSKDKFDENYLAWNYAIRGKGLDDSKKDIRVIVSFDQEEDLLIITAFYVT